MNEYYSIVGKEIKLSEIEKCELVKREYIYRPAFTEIMKSFGRRGYQFTTMQPYAAILNDEEKKKVKHKNIIGDVADGVVDTIDVLNLRKSLQKQYVCRNVAGRVFEINLKDVPAVVKRKDGRLIDVTCNDSEYTYIEDHIMPTIQMINALKITTATEELLFYGNGIQLVDPMFEYEHLRKELNEYRQTHPSVKKDIRLPKVDIKIPDISKINLPDIKKKK